MKKFFKNTFTQKSVLVFFLCSFLLYCALTIVIFHHRVPLFFTHYAMPDIDTEGGLWYQWYLSYIHKNQYIYDVTTFTGYPFGFDLAFSPVFNLIYSIQVFILDHIGFTWQHLIIVINTSSFLVYPLSAIGALSLCYYLTKNKIGSFIAGIVYAFSFNTVLWGRGQMSINHTEIIPFYLLSLFYFLDKKNIFSLTVSITLFALLFNADAYYAFFSGIFTIPIILIYHKDTILKKIQIGFSYYIPLLILFFLVNFNFILSNLYLFNKSLAVQSGRNSLPKNELFDILYHFSAPLNSFNYFHFGNYGHIFGSGLLLFLLLVSISLKRNRKYMLVLTCFVISVLLSSYIPNLFPVNELYFRFFSMFRSVARITVHTSLFMGLIIGIAITSYMNSKFYRKTPALFSYLGFGLFGFYIIFIALTSDGSWYKSTSFKSIESLYLPIKNNADIHAISAYPLTLNNGDNGFPPTYQLMGQLIYQKPLTAGLSPFADVSSKAYFEHIRDITHPATIDNLTHYGIDTILIYNDFDELKLSIDQIHKQLDSDNRLQFIGRYTAPKDPGYKSVIDRSKDISVYQIKKVVEENKTKNNQLFTTNEKNTVLYTKLSAYRYYVRIQHVTQKTILAFHLPYSDKWRLYPGDLSYTPNVLFIGKKNAVVDRIRVDEYDNGWVIDPKSTILEDAKIPTTQDMSFTVYFQPEAKRFVGSTISIVTLLLTGIYIVYYLIKQCVKK